MVIFPPIIFLFFQSSLIDDTDSDPNYSPDEDDCKNETHPTVPRTS